MRRKKFLTLILYITSWMVRVSIKMKWWNTVYKIVEFRKKNLAVEMRKEIKISYDSKRKS